MYGGQTTLHYNTVQYDRHFGITKRLNGSRNIAVATAPPTHFPFVSKETCYCKHTSHRSILFQREMSVVERQRSPSISRMFCWPCPTPITPIMHDSKQEQAEVFSHNISTFLIINKYIMVNKERKELFSFKKNRSSLLTFANRSQ